MPGRLKNLYDGFEQQFKLSGIGMPHVVKALATAPDWAHAGVSARELFMTKSSLDRSRVHEPAVPILMKRLNCKYNL